ncbi:adenylosuccinate synthase [Faecalicoccus pleomorphus]|uniref:Adenylosuccinate synthetase n=1 Tax=Faecalicoccus pleomorphus TaxID=1323 RepID=A0A7X9RIA8_9FIRM|nr:adenylosuccinate synthase [Faecalicoccus pleomorphus]MBM6678277.1 adenylosuccinate synthase [Faecalicoccus pleomorphus]MBM6765171.1 adenylosuccinate synthase [Faecalicoccus pleomorphus]MDB7987107.1 adenylosuccinate synthase [Faecalicoccus pleomorphus]MDB7990963.1 adenylosuccinate synthase [Faecalicoccus pleomorphus]MDM8292973.1 adenylosuccinate synthase [Faecalicoccus pleomorphus]
MPSQVIVGTQWGDEGKGKIVDVLAQKADMIVRFQGGDNAGHTVIVQGKKHVLHLLPSGVLNPNALCVIGPGVVCNPFVLLKEMETLKQGGLTCDHIIISDRAQMLMPYHCYQDELEEQSASHKIGTTKKGIGPCYADKYARRGIRFHEFIDFESFKVRLKECLDFKNKLFTKVYDGKAMDYDQMVKDFEAIYDQIVPMIKETTHIVNEALDEDKIVLFEGAQAAMLDINYGTYPYVTSSSPTSAGVTTGACVAPNRIQTVVGVVKAYSTRVGEGPFVTELNDETGQWIREKGFEYGATTGRPRRCGWLDLLVVKHATMMNGLTDIVLTKIDVLSGLDKLYVCTGYEIDGKVYDYIPSDQAMVAKAKPIYKEFDGWKEDISKMESFDELPENCKAYIRFIEEFTGVRMSMVSVGPDRVNNIYIHEI